MSFNKHEAKAVSAINGRRIYLYSCNTCEKDLWIRGNNLTRQKTTLCQLCSNKTSKNRKEPFRWLYNKLVANSASRKIEFFLTFDEFLEFTNTKVCAYCKKDLLWKPFSSSVGSSHSAGGYNLDRTDNTKGYDKHNVIACCIDCNLRKGKWWSGVQFSIMMQALREHGLEP